jgi:hypothetical protein
MLALILVAACGTKPNPAVCCISQADCDSVGIREPVRNCQGGLVCVDNACIAPECEVDQDCTGETPYCSEQTCVGCRDDGDCAGNAPVCDIAEHACRGCDAYAEFTSQACDFETGACISSASVLYASSIGSVQAECSQQQPCSITHAISAVSATRFTVKLAAGVYTANVLITKNVDIHGDGATVVAGAGAPTLRQEAGKARIYGLALVNNNTDATPSYLGFYCVSGELSLHRVAVEAVKTPGAFLQCKLNASRSTLKSPRNVSDHSTLVAGESGVGTFDRTQFIGGGTIACYGAHLTITNSVLDGLLGGAVDGAVATTPGGSVSISFSTIFNSPLACSGDASAACASASRTGVCIDNSIINKPSSLSDAVSGTNTCRFTHSIISPQQAPVPGDNNMIGASPSFKDPANEDFHLNADSPAINAADPSAAETPDYDGVMRPQGGRSDIGAFEFKE